MVSRYAGGVNLKSPFGGGRSGVRDTRGALSYRPFRRLWIALSLSSLGDWLSLFALAGVAGTLTRHAGPIAVTSAVSGVWISSLLPALVLGPLAGAVADRFDRRMNMIVGDVVRAALYLSIAINLSVGVVSKLSWMYLAQFLASCASLFWTPAKDATVPNLVPADQLESANQLSLLTAYGTAPVAGFLLAALSEVAAVLGSISHYFRTNPVSLALYFNVATFVVSALTVAALELPRRETDSHVSAPSVLKAIWDGWRFLGSTRVVRGIVTGMVGAFAAAGVVVGVGLSYVQFTLRGGNAGWGIVVAAIFIGLAGGMFLGMRVLRGFSRHRLFGMCIAFAGIPLAVASVIPNFPLVVLMVVVIGACAGVGYVTGYTIVGLEVNDDTRGRTFAFLQSAVRVILFLVIAISPALAAGFGALASALGGGQVVQIGSIRYVGIGDNLVLLLAAAVAIVLGTLAYRQMDDRKGVPLLADLASSLRRTPFRPVPAHPNGAEAGTGMTAAASTVPGSGDPGRPRGPRGLLLALEGGEGAGKSTQARLLAIWLREQGYDVVSTYEPGATKVGMRLRALLLDTAHTGLSGRAEALMYAADRAEHVSSTIRPAIERGAIVVTDRYVDSSLAYQGAGRRLPAVEIRRLNEWATGGLTPALTILLDLPPAVGLGRRARSADRLEAEPAEFHERVRAAYLALAAAEPGRYLVLDATRPAEEISREVQARVRGLLPDPVPVIAEETTGTFPAVRE